MRPTHKTMAAVAALIGGVALLAMISLRVSDQPSTIPPTRAPATVVPLPVQRGVVPLEPDDEVALIPPKVHRATSTGPDASG